MSLPPLPRSRKALASYRLLLDAIYEGIRQTGGVSPEGVTERAGVSS